MKVLNRVPNNKFEVMSRVKHIVLGIGTVVALNRPLLNGEITISDDELEEVVMANFESQIRDRYPPHKFQYIVKFDSGVIGYYNDNELKSLYGGVKCMN